jgi:hypothetical protein
MLGLAFRSDLGRGARGGVTVPPKPRPGKLVDRPYPAADRPPFATDPR